MASHFYFLFVVIPGNATSIFLSLPLSFRRRPESSGLNKPFPQSGNDNRGGIVIPAYPPWAGLDDNLCFFVIISL